MDIKTISTGLAGLIMRLGFEETGRSYAVRRVE